jgi:hypothetical protein
MNGTSVFSNIIILIQHLNMGENTGFGVEEDNGRDEICKYIHSLIVQIANSQSNPALNSTGDNSRGGYNRCPSAIQGSRRRAEAL